MDSKSYEGYGQGPIEKSSPELLYKKESQLVGSSIKAAGGLCEMKDEMMKAEVPPTKPTEEERVVFRLFMTKALEQMVHDTPHGLVIGLHAVIPSLRVRQQLATELLARLR